MKKQISFLLSFFYLSVSAYSQGVAIVNIDSVAQSFTVLKLDATQTTVTINNQVATTVTTQHFENNSTDTTDFKYAFPLPESAGATKIRWQYNQVWNTAYLIGASQDSSFQTDSNATTTYLPATLDTFLGKTPLYFTVAIQLAPGDTIAIELSYVEFLPYFNNKVTYHYPGKYDLIQNGIDLVSFDFFVSSYRSIDSILPLGYSGWSSSISGSTAIAQLVAVNSSFSNDLELSYLLHPDSIGFFNFSTYYPDSILKCDTMNGFFMFVVEPNSIDTTDIIEKDFALIIDHSGSMSGIKMSQANEAAEFIVNHLNTGDRFNIIQFDDNAESFSPGFVDYTANSQSMALNYISGISADGSTNISGAFDLTVPMFAASGTDRAKIIIFFTDGQPSAGITDINPLISHITNLIGTTSPDINLHAFGIGSDVNAQLLSQLAQNNGSSAFLDNNNVATAISNFYTTIQSPVLLNTTVSFGPQVVFESYPDPLPNIYKGHQLVVTGRYTVPGPVTVTLNGMAFGQPVSYTYNINLTDSLIEGNDFLPKLWAMDKIDHLMNQYYLNQSDQNLANAIKNEIIELSFCWGVVSPFTSFDGNFGGGGGLGIEEATQKNNSVELLYAFPNPVTDISRIVIPSQYANSDHASVTVFALEGRKIVSFAAEIQSGNYVEINADELGLAKGIYQLEVLIGDKKFLVKLVVT